MNEASGDDDDDEVMNGSHDDAGAEGSDFDMDTSSSHQTKEKVPAWKKMLEIPEKEWPRTGSVCCFCCKIPLVCGVTTRLGTLGIWQLSDTN